MRLVDSEAIGRRVAEARSRAGLTQAELAGAVGLDRSALSKIEAGLRRLTAMELARIAEETGEAFEWFVTDPPAAIISYKTGTGESANASIDRLLERVARDVELLQSLGYLDVDALDAFSQPEDTVQAGRLAGDARGLLNVEHGGPITNLAGAVADIGLFAFSRNLGPDAPDAATTLLPRGAVTIINSDRAVGRRRLALSHELGHYLLADEYTVDWRVGAWTNADRVEWLLDTFGRALLLPTESVEERWRDLKARGSTRDAAVRIASEYRVDMATLATRLAELGVVGGHEASQIRATTTTRSDIIEHDLVVAHDLDGTTLPRQYERAVLALYRSERISADRAIDLLHGTIDVGGLPALPPVAEGEIWKFAS